MQVTTQFVVKPRDKLCDLLLRDGGGQVDVPDGQAGEVVVARKQAVQKSRAAAEIAQDEERFFDRLFFVAREENIIQQEAEPICQPAQRPNQVEQKEKDQSFAGQAGWRAFPFEKRAVEHAPEQAEVVGHEEGGFLGLILTNKKAIWPFGSGRLYQIFRIRH